MTMSNGHDGVARPCAGSIAGSSAAEGTHTGLVAPCVRAMSLSDLLDDLDIDPQFGLVRSDLDGISVNGISSDSRTVSSGDVYVALQGGTVHGLDFVDRVIASDAAALLVDKNDPRALELKSELQNELAVVSVEALSSRLGELASRFLGYPSRQIPVCGITGTDGKTSVCRFVTEALNFLGHKAGYIGTIGWGFGDELEPNPLTTPDPVRLQQMIATLYENGAEFLALEVSSHALVQGRVNGVEFDVAALTNLGRDHLDFHGTVENYRAAKARLFTLKGLDAVVLNTDDDFGLSLANSLTESLAEGRGSALTSGNDSSESQLQVVGYSSDGAVSVESPLATTAIMASNVKPVGDGLRFDLTITDPAVLSGGQSAASQTYAVNSTLLGTFNVDNLLACVGVLKVFGIEDKRVVEAIQSIRPVKGRMECFRTPKRATLVVDFAHTPQALSSALGALRQHCSGRLWVVFGCGGDRDAGKRPLMGEIADRLADYVVVTDDNPRTEESAEIIQDIVSGIKRTEDLDLIADREKAVRSAFEKADVDDWILIAGKGHENHQIVGAEYLDFSDISVVQTLQAECAL